MIWYKNIPDEIKNNVRLAATWLSAYELFKSSDRRVGVLINNWARIRDNSSYIIPLSPEQHFHFYLNGGQVIYPEIFEQQKATAGIYDLILEKKKARQLTIEQWKQFETQAATLRSDYIDRFGLWVDQINSYKRNYPTTQAKTDFLTSPDGIEAHMHQVTMPLIMVLLSDIQELDSDDFLKFELFIHVFNQWLIDLDLGDDVAEVNDLIDVFNMIFVTPIDKYWTEEKQWIKRIKKVGLEHYLFDPTVIFKQIIDTYN